MRMGESGCPDFSRSIWRNKCTTVPAWGVDFIALCGLFVKCGFGVIKALCVCVCVYVSCVGAYVCLCVCVQSRTRMFGRQGASETEGPLFQRAF